MLGTLIQSFKLLRYLLPFLIEVSNEADCKLEEDKVKARRLRSVIAKTLWKITFTIGIVGGVVFAVFHYVIPIYSENLYYKDVVTQKSNRINYLESKLDTASLNQNQAMLNTTQCTQRLDNVSRENIILRDELRKHP